MLLWTLRTWPKAQYLARALAIPAEAWEIPYLFVAIGGPELSVFEAMEKPELGGLTTRLKALTKPVAAAAYNDAWVREEVLAGSKLAVAFHPGVTAEQVREMSERDGYRVLDMAAAMTARGSIPHGDDWRDEGLSDAHATCRAAWREEGADDDELLARTLALDVWESHDHSAAHYLASRPADWPRLATLALAKDRGAALRALASLVLDAVEHPVLIKPLAALAARPELAGVFDDATRTRASELGRLRR